MASTVVLAQAGSAADWASWVGAIGTWFGGLATTAAVVVALWISHRDWSRADSERRDEEKTQARLVVARVLHTAMPKVEVVNNSRAPVLNVDVAYVADGRPDGLIGKLGSVQPLPIDVLGASESKTLSVIHLSAEPQHAVVATSDYYPEQRDEITLTLTDSKGRRWRRVNNSPPVRVSDAGDALDTPRSGRGVRELLGRARTPPSP